MSTLQILVHKIVIWIARVTARMMASRKSHVISTATNGHLRSKQQIFNPSLNILFYDYYFDFEFFLEAKKI